MPEPAQRLAELLSEPRPTLDRIMAVVASIAPSPPTEDEIVVRFDALAAELVPGGEALSSNESDLDRVIRHVFVTLGFVGNAAHYYSPDNSFIHRVLDTRRGIPLTLAAVGAEVARRHGVDLRVVGLPGHVVLGIGPEPERWIDPFRAGMQLDLEMCRWIAGRSIPIERFHHDMTRPIDATAFTTRMLGNLKLVYRRRGDLGGLAAALNLSVAIPNSPVSERQELAAVLAALGRDELAAVQRERLIVDDPANAASHRVALHRHRARRN
ncbi:MAG: transglutaminase-like domain-containing protein [Actinomycetota bacterium]